MRRDLAPQLLPDAIGDLKGDERVGAQLEEVVVNAYAFDAEQLTADGGDPALGLVARRNVGCAEIEAGLQRGGISAARARRCGLAQGGSRGDGRAGYLSSASDDEAMIRGGAPRRRAGIGLDVVEASRSREVHPLIEREEG